MSEKAVLINKIPPVSKSALPADSSSVGGESNATSAQVGVSITPIQATTYASSVLGFVLAGCMAVVLFRSASKSLGAHLSPAAKLLAAAFGFSALYGLFATYLYRNYLYDANLGAPLVGFFALWVILGALIGAVLVKVQTGAAKIGALIPTAGVFSAAFICTVLTLALSGNENAALGLSLLAVAILFISALGQIKSSQLFKRKNPELCPDPFLLLVYLLALVPLAVPVLGLVSALGILNSDLSLLIYQVGLCGFIAGAGVLMLRALSKNAAAVPAAKAAAVPAAKTAAVPAAKAAAVPAAKAAAVPAAKAAAVPAAKAAAQEAVHFDPLIAQLKQEDAAVNAPTKNSNVSSAADAKADPTPQQEIKSSPQAEPEVKLPKVPKAPKKKASAPPAPQDPGSRPNLKAPNKPQKRF